MTRPAFNPTVSGRLRRWLATACLLALGGAHAAELRVFAAASLTDAFSELGRAFDAKTGHTTTFQFAGSSALRAQLENGARADLYASANEAQFDALVKAGLLSTGEVFARNRLVVITPAASTRVQRLADLARPGVKLVLAQPEVPAGEYARQALTSLGASGAYGADFTARALKNVASEESNVRRVALKVQLGEADAGIVYASDITPNVKARVRQLPLPPAHSPTASYPIGVLNASKNAEQARAFIAYARSTEGQRILRKWGFLGAPAAPGHP